MDNAADMTSQERAAVIAWWLADGEALSTLDIAERLALSRQGAWTLVTMLSRKLPIWCNGDGKWKRCDSTDMSTSG
jgi:hypothetical protein